MKYRPQKGDLSTALAEMVCLSSGTELVAHLSKNRGGRLGEIVVEPYGHGMGLHPDARIGWKDTWIVLIDGVPAGYIDQPPLAEHATREPWRPAK